MITLDAEVLSQVNNLDMGRNGVLIEELFTFSVTKTEEDDIYLVKGQGISKSQFCFPDESFMYIAQQIASIAFRVRKHYLSFRMVEQQANQLSASITCRTQYSYFNHIAIANFSLFSFIFFLPCVFRSKLSAVCC